MGYNGTHFDVVLSFDGLKQPVYDEAPKEWQEQANTANETVAALRETFNSRRDAVDSALTNLSGGNSSIAGFFSVVQESQDSFGHSLDALLAAWNERQNLAWLIYDAFKVRVAPAEETAAKAVARAKKKLTDAGHGLASYDQAATNHQAAESRFDLDARRRDPDAKVAIAAANDAVALRDAAGEQVGIAIRGQERAAAMVERLVRQIASAA